MPLPYHSLFPGSLPARSPSPKSSGRLGSNPYAWVVLSRPCPLDTSRTPYQTSGLPAGAEPYSEGEIILPLTTRDGRRKAFHLAIYHTLAVLILPGPLQNAARGLHRIRNPANLIGQSFETNFDHDQASSRPAPLLCGAA